MGQVAMTLGNILHSWVHVAPTHCMTRSPIPNFGPLFHPPQIKATHFYMIMKNYFKVYLFYIYVGLHDIICIYMILLLNKLKVLNYIHSQHQFKFQMKNFLYLI